MTKRLFRASKLNKAFVAPVLKNLDFELREGEVHALMGSNGAGKSTLCNIICGVHAPDSGNFEFAGQSYTPRSLKDSEALGICMVMQELNLFPTLSVAENLFFRSMSDKFGIVRHKALERRAHHALQSVGLVEIDPAQPLSQLGVGQQQLVEIASVLQRPLRLLVLDEPTAALTDPQVELLFTQIAQLKTKGVGIIYISHRMDEISRIADRVSVLRDGELVATEDVADMDVDRMVTLMTADSAADLATDVRNVAASCDTHTPTIPQPERAQAVVLKVENLSRRVRSASGGYSGFENVSLELHAGEVLGIGGLIGSGRTELLRAIFGADEAHTGAIRLLSDNFQKRTRMRSPAQGLAQGIGLLVEDRKAQGLFLSGSVPVNISFASLAKLTGKLGVVLDDDEEKLAGTMSEALNIRYDSLRQSVSTLSGGNQQKTLIARLLAADLAVLLFDEPSRGVDARTKLRIQQLIREQAALGKALVVVSSEMQELMQVSDRVAIMSNGRVAGIFSGAELTEEALLNASFRFYDSQDTDTTIYSIKAHSA